MTQDENDPLNRVIGRKPDKSLPWHINVCRQRIRERGEEYSAFSPTGAEDFHHLLKFAHFYDGNSHQFDAAEPDADFLEATRIAANLARTGKHEAALAAYVAATGFARSDPIYRVVETTDRMNAVTTSDLQKSAALEQAAASARLLRKHDVAAELAARIPIDAVKKSVLMQNLLDQFKAKQVIEQFGSEDIANWPFWKAGDGYFTRGHAYAITKAGQEAETDLLRALEWTSDPRIRDSIRQSLGGNRETNLKDDTAALATYHEIIDNVKQLGSADHFNAVQGIARIQTRRGKFEGRARRAAQSRDRQTDRLLARLDAIGGRRYLARRRPERGSGGDLQIHHRRRNNRRTPSHNRRGFIGEITRINPPD